MTGKARGKEEEDSWEIVRMTTSGNLVRHIVSSQDDAVAELLGR